MAIKNDSKLPGANGHDRPQSRKDNPAAGHGYYVAGAPEYQPKPPVPSVPSVPAGPTSGPSAPVTAASAAASAPASKPAGPTAPVTASSAGQANATSFSFSGSTDALKQVIEYKRSQGLDVTAEQVELGRRVAQEIAQGGPKAPVNVDPTSTLTMQNPNRGPGGVTNDTSVPTPEQPVNPPQQFDMGAVVSQITNAVGSMLNSAGNDAASQALIAQWMDRMSAQLAQIESTVLKRIQEQGSMEDPALRAAFAQLNEEFDLKRKELLEDLAARGVAQSGIMVDVEARMQRGLLSEKEKMIAGRLSEMENALTQAIMNFANQRMGIMQFGAQASIGSNMAAMDRQFRAQQTQISSLLNLAGLGQQADQFNRGLQFQGQQNELNRQHQTNLQQGQQTWQSNENVLQRNHASQMQERQFQWATSERVQGQEFQAQQAALNREFQSLLQQNEFNWRGNQAAMDRDLQRWILQKQQEYGWSMAEAQHNYAMAQQAAQQSWADRNREDSQAHDIQLAGMKSSGTDQIIQHAVGKYMPLLQSGQMTPEQVRQVAINDFNRAVADGANVSSDALNTILMMINSYRPGQQGTQMGGYPASNGYNWNGYAPGTYAGRGGR